MYVGLATVWGFIWWYLWYDQGPKLSWHALSHFQKCDATMAAAGGYKCEIFMDRHPKTIAMTVLVVVEMFNALNNISENCSLAVIPFWDNQWLLGAIGVSMALHCLIMYIPGLSLLFGITHLNWAEWRYVIIVSAPVIFVDEVLKWLSRRGSQQGARSSGRISNRGGVQMPLVSIQVTSPLLSTSDKRH